MEAFTSKSNSPALVHFPEVCHAVEVFQSLSSAVSETQMLPDFRPKMDSFLPMVFLRHISTPSIDCADDMST